MFGLNKAIAATGEKADSRDYVVDSGHRNKDTMIDKMYLYFYDSGILSFSKFGKSPGGGKPQVSKYCNTDVGLMSIPNYHLFSYMLIS